VLTALKFTSPTTKPTSTVRNIRGLLSPSRTEGANFPLSVTKALTKMKELGEAENPSYGYWKILPADTEVMPEHADANGSANLSDRQSAAAHSPDDPLAEVTIGTGPGCVYAYYLPTYRMRAQERGEHSWPCKIGETEGNALYRVLSQVSTALPERPIFPVVFRSNYSKALEKAFHMVFTLRGLRIENVPGVEWFLTSPSEIIALAKVFDPRSYGTLHNSDEAMKGLLKATPINVNGFRYALVELAEA
jgi:hypothetical protein